MDDNVKIKMDKVIEALDIKLINIRAGRANPGMVSNINVVYYGSPVTLQSIANITVPEARQLMIKPFDRGAIKDIEKAINEANIGISPSNNGEAVFLRIPELTEERRREYVKLAKTSGEEAKIALRNIRQDANNAVKKMELPEDEEKLYLEDIQENITKYNGLVDQKISEKEKELLNV